MTSYTSLLDSILNPFVKREKESVFENRKHNTIPTYPGKVRSFRGEKISVTSKYKGDQTSPLAGLQSGKDEGRLITSENLRSTCLELRLYTL